VQTFEHWIVEPDAHAPASCCGQRRAAYVRDRDERASGPIDLAAAEVATNLSDGATQRIGERIKAVYANLLGRTGAPATPDAEEAVMSWAHC
jgi:hypothetical protein